MQDHHFMLVLILARLLPIFSFDVITYGAGLPNISLKTFALTYLGSHFITSQIPLMIGGFIMVTFFMAIPKLVLQYPNAWWARWFLAASPSSTAQTTASVKRGGTCSGCDASLPEHQV